MSEVQDAMQVFAITIQGVEVCFRMTKELLKVLQKLLKFLAKMLIHEKQIGKTSMKKLLKQGVDLKACQVPNDKVKEFKKMAKKYGILYTEVPGGKGGMADILFRKEDIPRMNMMLEKMGLGKVKYEDILDFVDNMSEERMEDIAPEYSQEKSKEEEVSPNQDNQEVENTEDLSKEEMTKEKEKTPNQDQEVERTEDLTNQESMTEEHMADEQMEYYAESMTDEQMEYYAGGMTDEQMEYYAGSMTDEQMGYYADNIPHEQMEGYAPETKDVTNMKHQDVAINIQQNSLKANPAYEEISVVTKNNQGKLLLVDETQNKVKVRIPYEKDKFIWLDKKEAFISGDREKITAFLRRDRDYDIVDKSNQKVESMKGSELRKKHFEPVKQRQKNFSKDKTKQQSQQQNQTRSQSKPKRTKSK
ncbi:MAG: PcfB family protein [Lachnospiraceae bacterium]|nr:PcfB family protein [Lachnospiraceae bacterium]